MAEQIYPTKGNLINTKKSLALAELGYELLDRKRNILIREMMLLLDDAKSLRGTIDETYREAYKQLQRANITMGLVENVAHSVPIETGITVTYTSIMGVDIPKIHYEKKDIHLHYGLYQTNRQLDLAYISFDKVKQMTVILAEVENSIYRLAVAIKKTQSRANALKNIIIPRFTGVVKYITDNLEEKDREEFSRMKVIKVQKQRKQKTE